LANHVLKLLALTVAIGAITYLIGDSLLTMALVAGAFVAGVAVWSWLTSRDPRQ
jgi:hypothetical protein